jgi:pimeloyl-ACP methyl ester carboxylesterase
MWGDRMTTWVRSGSAELPVDRAGTGDPAVLLHAGVADRRAWRVTLDAPPDGWELAAYDRRGHGDARWEAEPHDPVDDLLAVLDHVGAPSAVLVGSSRGGRVAIDAALAHPDRVRALVLLAPAVRGAHDPHPVPPALQSLSDRLDAAEAADDLDEVDAVEAELWLDGPSRPAGTVGGSTRELFSAMNRLALGAADVGDEREPPVADAWTALEQVAAPSVVVVGAHDLPHVVARCGVLAARLPPLPGPWPSGQPIVLPDSAHLPYVDDPGRFAGVLADALAACAALPRVP